MSEQPGRYQRSSGGFVGALIVLLVVIGAFLALRAVSRDNEPTAVSSVDYVPVLKQARSSGQVIAPAPDPMPEGWRATSVRYVPGSDPTWHLGMLTDAGKYVGIEEAPRTPRDLVDQYLGDDATKGDPTRIRSRTWQAWTEPGGDYALTLRTPEHTVLVGGSAGDAVVQALTDRLALPSPAG